MNAKDRHDQQRWDALQQWLDGSLEGPDLADFERRCESDPELQAERQLQESIRASLRRGFEVPDLKLDLPKAPGPIEPRRARPWIPFLLGALGAAASMLVWLKPWASPEQPAEVAETAQMLRTAVGRSWLAVCEQPDDPEPPIDWSKPANVPAAPSQMAGCALPDQLPVYVQPLAPDLPSPLVWRAQPGVEFQRGLEEWPEDGLRVIELLVESRIRTFLFVVPSDLDPRPALPESSGWSLFREPRGPLVLYELTPLGEPRGLECVRSTN